MKLNQKIQKYRKERKLKNIRFSNLKLVKRCNKTVQALSLPKTLNLNPRSIYNKVAEFVTFVQEQKVDLACISESWEREGSTLSDIISIDGFEIISNVFQRRGIGGRPAIIVDGRKFLVENLTQTMISIPWGVEAVWALLTPKNSTNASKIQKIAVGSIYCKPKSRKKSLLLDHIAQVYNQVSSKFTNGLHWIICGDTNDLKLDSILDMNKHFKQVVQTPTRLNPPRIIDPIITTLASYYQLPQCLAPLDSDPGSKGKASDHLMVVMEPINVIDNKPARMKKKITFRAMKQENYDEMKKWIENEHWEDVFKEKCANKKAEIFQSKFYNKYCELFPEKSRYVSSDDQPFFTEKLKKLKRKKCREFQKNRRSLKYKNLHLKYKNELKVAKQKFYKQKIKHLKNSNPKKWHQELKKLMRVDQRLSEEIIVEDIKDFPDDEQAEIIANKFISVSQEYDKLKTDEIRVPEFENHKIPQFTEQEVLKTISEMDGNKSSIYGDVPSKIWKSFAELLYKPVTNVINASLKQGIWPSILKHEIVTPVPKKFPPKTVDDLRNISGLLNLDKVFEKLVSKLIIQDMKEKIDPSQYANQKGLSINHYLIKMIDKILAAVDKNDKVAVLATFVDWKQAFPRQCPKLGVESFLENGVRPALIPTLISYFQGRSMKVKWHKKISSTKELKGGGPQGGTLGIWEYLSQSNDNANCVKESERFKFVDDLSFLEIIHLLNVGLASFNVKQQVPTHIPVNNQFIQSKDLKSQQHLNIINDWTKKKKMKLNIQKTKNMIFNFTKKFQFSTNIELENNIIETESETKLLGTYITNDLRWNKNTSEIVKSAFIRMQILNRVVKFTTNRNDLRSIYISYIRSILEKSAVVWHSSLTVKNRKDLERIQKCAVLVIMGKNYTNYKNGLKELNLETLEKRRENLCLKFAKECLKNEKVKNMFAINKSMHDMKKRKKEKFKVKNIRTERYRKSALPYMTNLLNKYEDEKMKSLEII